MADAKISALGLASTPLAGSELIPLVQSGVTEAVTVSNLTVGREVDAKNLILTGAAATPIQQFAFGGSTTAFTYGVYSNTGSTVWFGMEGNSGGNLIGGTAAYDAILGTIGATDFHLVSGSSIRLTIKSGGDIGIKSGNIVPATAAKGMNFTANTPAAGMTSQLLNWYEEGTWTPVITAGTGTFGTVSGTGTYTRTGRTVYIDFNILITGNGTAAAYVKVAGLPWTASAYRGFGTGQETDAVGFEILAQVIGGTDYFYIQKNDLTYPGGDTYRLQGSLTYKV